jgi:hypothetical protein
LTRILRQPKHLWKYISKFKKNDQAVTQLELGTKIITEPQSIAEAFADRFSSVFDSSYRPKAPYYFDHTCSDLLNVPYVCDSVVKCAISHLRSTKSVGPDEIPNFIIKGCSDILFISCATFLTSVYLPGYFSRYGNRRLLFLFSRKVIKSSKVLYMITFSFISNLSYTLISMVSLNLNPRQLI